MSNIPKMGQLPTPVFSGGIWPTIMGQDLGGVDDGFVLNYGIDGPLSFRICRS